jgi:hypothetical protein
MDIDAIKNRIRLSVYHGAHVGSVRLQLLYWRVRSTKTPLTNAISYRLTTDPPSFMAVCNLERFADGLNQIGFFTHMKETLPIQYNDFKECMSRIHAVKHYANPYSGYMYNVNLPFPEIDISNARQLAPYAFALNAVLPNSTLLSSASLKKLTELTSVNAIGASMQVEAFVSAFRQYGKRIIERGFAVSGGLPRLLDN